MTNIRKKVKIAFIEKGVSGAGIARKLGVDRSAIYKTISGEIKARRLRKAIAEAIGAEVEDLWPKNGNRNNPRTPFIKGDNTPLKSPLNRGETERN